MSDTGSDRSVIVVGAGFGGLAAAIELRRHGFTDVTVLDASPALGGTWLHNTYPGAACDVFSHFYSFSYAQRRDWSRLCAPQPEILAYMQDVAREFGIDGLIASGSRVTACTWDDAQRRWTVLTEDGTAREAAAVVLATGQLHRPAIPAIPGVESFAGTAFHTARWDHGHDLRGRRVAVVGTGATAVQVVPEIASAAARTSVFQRSGSWLMPRVNRPYPPAVRWAIRHVPGVTAVRRRFIFEYCELLTQAIRHPRTLGRVLALRSALFMRSQLEDPELRRRAWPTDPFGCKRVLFSSSYLPALQRPDVDLVTEAIAEVRPEGIVTADGTLHAVDTIIWATGFRTNEFMFPMEVTGRAGVALRDQWAAGAHAHRGITVPGFPSLFLMYGPNTNTSGGSILTYLEAQARYLRQALELSVRLGAPVEVRPEVEAASDRELQGRFDGTAWAGCRSWYRTPSGRIVANWPGSMREYLAATERLDPAEYVPVGRAEAAATMDP